MKNSISAFSIFNGAFNMNSTIVCIFISLFVVLSNNAVNAQSAYYKYNYLGIESGIKIEEEIINYSDSISELIDVYMSEDFAVYDVSHYLISTFYSDSFSNAANIVNTIAEGQSSNYFLIQKGYEKDGSLKAISGYLSLDTDAFECLDDSLLNLLIDNALKLNESGSVDENTLEVLKLLYKVLKDGFCCSESMNYGPDLILRGSCSSVNQSKVDAIVNIILTDTSFNSIILKIETFLELYSEGCTMNSEMGIMPKCYWENINLDPLQYYGLMDRAFMSGCIDGFYNELKALYDLIDLLPDLAIEVDHFVKAYSWYYILCTHHGLNPTADEFMFVVMGLGAKEESEWYAPLAYNFFNSYVLPNSPLIFEIYERFTNSAKSNCEKYVSIHNTVESVLDAISNMDTWVSLYRKFIDEASEVWEDIDGFSNIERYYQGYYGISIVSAFVPLGPGKYIKLSDKASDLSNAATVNKVQYSLNMSAKMAQRKINELLKLTPPLFNGDQGKHFLFRQDFEQDYNTLMRILDDGIPGGKVAAWEKIKHSLDAGIAAKATDVPFLQKFDDIVQNNNLGLDAEGLKAVLNAAALKGQKWDFPENILDAVKRASDGSISGMVVSHKKFPTAASGNSGGYLVPAKEYQKAASGDTNLSFEVGGRSFDNVGADGKLVDRKFGHSNSIFDRVQNEFGEVDLVVHNPTRVKSLLTQAKGQLDAANGHPIRWEISTSTGKEGIESIFNGNFPQFLEDFPGVDFSVIEVVHVPL